MSKEISFDDEDGVYPIDDEVYEDDALMDSKIPVGRFARIIDEFEATNDDDDESDIDFDSLGLH